MTWVFVASTAYQTECFPTQAASLVALAGLLRNVAAAIAAAIIHPLAGLMGLGWCFTGLAILDLLGVLGVLLIVKKGPAFRRALEGNDAKPIMNKF
jgi:MFS family permease